MTDVILKERFYPIPEEDTRDTELWVCYEKGEVKVSKKEPATAGWTKVIGPDKLSEYMIAHTAQNGPSRLNISTEELDNEQTQMLLQGLENITCGNINLKTAATQLDAKMVCADNVNIEGKFVDVVNLPETTGKCTINSQNVSKVYFGKNRVDELIVQNSEAKKMVIKNNVHANKIVLLNSKIEELDFGDKKSIDFDIYFDEKALERLERQIQKLPEEIKKRIHKYTPNKSELELGDLDPDQNPNPNPDPDQNPDPDSNPNSKILSLPANGEEIVLSQYDLTDKEKIVATAGNEFIIINTDPTLNVTIDMSQVNKAFLEGNFDTEKLVLPKEKIVLLYGGTPPQKK